MNSLIPFQELADRLENRAEQRLEETPGDPAAVAMAWAAKLLRETIASVTTNDQWWTTDRVAAECGCSVAAVQNWCRNAERLGVRVIQKPSRAYLLHRDDVLRMRNDRQQRRPA